MFGKQAKVSFQEAGEQAKGLVHSDVWGPAATPIEPNLRTKKQNESFFIGD